MSKLHDQLIVIDGLNVSNFGRSVFEDMHRGGVTAANCTSCVWENITETMRNTAKWKTWLRENADLITQVYTTDDIRRVKTENKTGIILGWQNSSGIEDIRNPPQPDTHSVFPPGVVDDIGNLLVSIRRNRRARRKNRVASRQEGI